MFCFVLTRFPVCVVQNKCCCQWTVGWEKTNCCEILVSLSSMISILYFPGYFHTVNYWTIGTIHFSRTKAWKNVIRCIVNMSKGTTLLVRCFISIPFNWRHRLFMCIHGDRVIVYGWYNLKALTLAVDSDVSLYSFANHSRGTCVFNACNR